MARIENGTPGAQARHLTWKKSRRSSANGACVELAVVPEGGVAVRNSRFPDGPVLVYTDAEIEALILGVKDGDFDELLAEAQA